MAKTQNELASMCRWLDVKQTSKKRRKSRPSIDFYHMTEKRQPPNKQAVENAAVNFVNKKLRQYMPIKMLTDPPRAPDRSRFAGEGRGRKSLLTPRKCINDVTARRSRRKTFSSELTRSLRSAERRDRP